MYVTPAASGLLSADLLTDFPGNFLQTGFYNVYRSRSTSRLSMLHVLPIINDASCSSQFVVSLHGELFLHVQQLVQISLVSSWYEHCWACLSVCANLHLFLCESFKLARFIRRLDSFTAIGRRCGTRARNRRW